MPALDYQSNDDLKPVPQPEDLQKPEKAGAHDVTVEARLLARRALDLYLRDNLAPEQIAVEMGIPYFTVLAWFTAGRWVNRRKELERAERAEATRRYDTAVTLARPGTAKEQLERGALAEKLVELSIREMLEAVESKVYRPKPSELKQLMEALAAATSIRARAVGLDAKSAADANAEAASELEERQSYVMGAKLGKIEDKTSDIVLVDDAMPTGELPVSQPAPPSKAP